MSGVFEMFENSESDVPVEPQPVKTISQSQREAIRSLFREMNVASAAEQFAIVKDITGQVISSVNELPAVDAQKLIHQLPARIRTRGEVRSGNAWDDRVEDTWIDKL